MKSNLFYTTFGKGKQSVILLHGLTSSHSAWKLMEPYLKQLPFTYYAIDLAGHGFSPRLPFSDFGVNDHVQDLHDFVITKKLQNVILIGHCYGGYVSALFSSRYPELVKRLILINSGSSSYSSIQKTRPIYSKFFQFASKFLALFPDATAYIKSPIQKTQVDYLKYIGTGEFNIIRISADLARCTLYTPVVCLNDMFTHPKSALYSRIKAPTLVLAGIKDKYFPYGTLQKMADTIPLVEFKKINSNHIGIMNKPNIVYEEIKSFLFDNHLYA